MKMKWVVRDTDRHGNQRIYLRMPGKRKIRLDPSDLVASYYKALLAGRLQPSAGEDSSFIYVIGGNEPPMKIGRAISPRQRLHTIQTGNPNQVVIHRAIAVPRTQVAKIERYLHREFANKHVSGEWFDISPVEAISTIERLLLGEIIEHVEVPLSASHRRPACPTSPQSRRNPPLQNRGGAP